MNGNYASWEDSKLLDSHIGNNDIVVFQKKNVVSLVHIACEIWHLMII